jgi:hypothetical protein
VDLVNRPFIPGLDLSGLLYREVVEPLMARHFPDLDHSAALLGAGSEVLGFDTPQSMDHDWGPRLMLFLTEEDHATTRDALDRVLRQELPIAFHGYPTHFKGNEDGTGVMALPGQGPIDHRVLILTVRDFFSDLLTFDPTGEIEVVDWVRIPAYRLLMATAGRVFHDGLGRLAPIRAKLHYYPDGVWLYVLAAQWRRIAQEEAFMGRCGQVGDELGSRLVAARLVKDLMGLGFLMERAYPPYIKWFGRAFAQLDCADDLLPVLKRVLAATSWEARQAHLTTAYAYAAAMHNALGITEPLPPEVSPFHNRPFLVIHGDRFVDAIRAEIRSEVVLALPEHLGAYDQFVDSTDALRYLERFRVLYES